MTVELDEDVRLLKNSKFRRLLEARLVGQTAQNAMLYALLILVVDKSDSSLSSTLLIIALTLPAILFGIPAGTIADFLPKRFTLTLGYLARAVITAALIYYDSDLVSIYLLAFLASTVSQFFGPAESATVPAIVRRDQLPAANSLMVLSIVLAQIAGLVVMAPILLKLIGADAVFVVCTGLFIGATYIIGWMASDFTREEDERRPRIGFIEATREGFQILRRNRHAYLAVVYIVMTVALSKALVILLPKYTRDVLSISTEDTVYVAAPAAIGAALGLVLTPALTRVFGAWRVVAFGFVVFLLGIIGLGLVVYVRDFIQANVDFGISFLEDKFSVPSVITVTMLLAMPIGFAFTVVNVASRVVMNEQAPPEAQGRVFAVQVAIGDFLTLIPLLIVGAVADLVGVRATLLAAALAAVAGALYLTFSRRFGPPPEEGAEVSLERPPGTAEHPA